MEEMQEAVEAQESVQMNNDNIVPLISVGDWGEVLSSLTQDMDPWDIDLAVLNTRLTEHIMQMRRLDLRIPAKILLAAAIIYKLKSETIGFEEEEPPAEEPEFSEDFSIDGGAVADEGAIVIPPIQLPLHRSPRRKITLDELVDALGKAMKIKTRREAREFFQMDLAGIDITKNIEELYEKICAFLGKGGKVTFSGLLGLDNSKEKKIRAFNSMLHLASEGRIVCIQPELFGEIEIMGREHG